MNKIKNTILQTNLEKVANAVVKNIAACDDSYHVYVAMNYYAEFEHAVRKVDEIMTAFAENEFKRPTYIKKLDNVLGYVDHFASALVHAKIVSRSDEFRVIDSLIRDEMRNH